MAEILMVYRKTLKKLIFLSFWGITPKLMVISTRNQCRIKEKGLAKKTHVSQNCDFEIIFTLNSKWNYFFSKWENLVVDITVNFENKTFRIDTLAKISLFSNVGLLNPNILLVFASVYSVANFRVARYRKLGTVLMAILAILKRWAKKKCHIRIKQPKITI